MNKLISITDFVFETKKCNLVECEKKCESFDKIIKYAQFLKQPLKLEMFVPCDEDSNVLEEIKFFDPDISLRYYAGQNYQNWSYDKAKEKVLFDGFEKDFMNLGHKYVVNKDLQIVNEYEAGLSFYEIFTTRKPKEVYLKTIEDLIPYNLTLTKNAIDKHEL